MLSLLVGAAAGGLLGALLAVPIVASAEIILSQLQAREKPVAQDPAAIETPDEDARGDHRIAMAAAVVGLGVDGVLVEDIATTRKTVPDFAGSWQRMLTGS